MRIKNALMAMSAVATMLAGATHSEASSHREAPFITKNPKVDATDFYMFRSYENGRSAYTTIVANYVPLQDAYGGPNYFTMDPEAIYEIHVDNNNDAQEDITFQFRFSNALANAGNGIALPIGDDAGTKNVAIPLAIAGGIQAADGGVNEGVRNVLETYTLKVIRGNRRTGTAQDVTNAAGGSTTFAKPIDNIGVKTFASSYENYARTFIHTVNIPGCGTPAKVFVGQRKESFAVNLGVIFDLVNAPLAAITSNAARNAFTGTARSNIANDKNVTSLALEVPTACLTSGSQTIIGGWTTASIRQARAINPNATYGTPAREGGAWAQVSRLGNPLVNEVVIGLKDKDRFNSSEPKNDGQFADYVTNPTLPELIEIIFGSANAPAPNLFPRADLVTAFLTGVDNVNKNGATAEYLRLNTALNPTAAASQNDLGALECFTPAGTATAPALDTNLASCDPTGFPNGRRPGDDVVDIALRVVMGRLLPNTVAPAGAAPLHDAVLQNQSQFDQAFPYLKTPYGGTIDSTGGG